ncbi:hypothetical protein CC80DRAFT_34280 [Byssothecium circinans]|uniref:Uncharacterized protein n=1 Tax=Byssothecium circinans TaxID=147558 RepID=A0A6A5TZR1_9PLEO|nr:hypothetical protein CC80DRAFT_34280 [Byssothecium circinans]
MIFIRHLTFTYRPLYHMYQNFIYGCLSCSLIDGACTFTFSFPRSFSPCTLPSHSALKGTRSRVSKNGKVTQGLK